MTDSAPRLDRRELLRTLTAAGVGSAFAGAAAAQSGPGHQIVMPGRIPPSVAALGQRALAAGTCSLTPESTSGPFYFDTGLIRQDITEGKPGVPTFVFLQIVDQNNNCQPIPGAVFDLWHCDALGSYSGYASEGTAGETFCRGIQIADGNGIVLFQTIFPGTYVGRTTHFHLKARPALESSAEITAQLYFDDLYATVINKAIAPYDTNPAPVTTNPQDGIYVTGGGAETTMPVFVIPGPPVALVTGIQIVVPVP